MDINLIYEEISENISDNLLIFEKIVLKNKFIHYVRFGSGN